MKHPLFNEMVRTKTHVIARSIRKGNVTMVNRSRILWRWPIADGVKTGHTQQAGHCFIGSATKYGWRLLSVVLNSPQVGVDTQTVLTYGFQNYRSLKLARRGDRLGEIGVQGGQSPRVGLAAAGDLYAVVRQGAPIPQGPTIGALAPMPVAPVSRGAKAGRASWACGGRPDAFSVDLITLDAVPATPVQTITSSGSGWLLPAFGVLAASIWTGFRFAGTWGRWLRRAS